MLFCFVIDGSPLMLRSPRDVAEESMRGLTPGARAKALIADMIRDLARYFPRTNVKADVALYLWSPDEAPDYRERFDLFELDASHCSNRLAFATDLAELTPPYFQYRLHVDDQDEFVHLDENPYDNLERMSKETHYHCKHLVMASSAQTVVDLIPSRDLDLIGHTYSRDSIWCILADVSESTLGIARPVTIGAMSAPGGGITVGQRLSEERLRVQFLESALLKAAARRPQRVLAELGDEVNE